MYKLISFLVIEEIAFCDLITSLISIGELFSIISLPELVFLFISQQDEISDKMIVKRRRDLKITVSLLFNRCSLKVVIKALYNI